MGVNSTQSRGGVKGGFPLAGSRGGAPLWGLGQRPNCSSSNQLKGSRQQRRRQRSVPASNFALPQERPPTRSIHHFHIVAPNGRDRIATGSAALNAADPVFRFNHPMPASNVSSHSAASSSAQSSSQPSSSQSPSSSVCPIPLNADAGAVPTNISSSPAYIIR